MALFVLIFFYFFGKTILNKLTYFLVILFFLIIVLMPVTDFILKNNLLHSIFIERIFFDQSLMTYCYFDFFQDKPVFFSESFIFNKIFTYPYDLSSANLIGKVYFNNPLSHANTGIVGDGFMNLGYIGVVLLSMIFSSIFLFFNSIDFDKRYFGVFFLLIFDFLNNSLLSTFLSGGLWILIIFSLTIMKFKAD
jgi:hypothetical protein